MRHVIARHLEQPLGRGVEPVAVALDERAAERVVRHVRGRVDHDEALTPQLGRRDAEPRVRARAVRLVDRGEVRRVRALTGGEGEREVAARCLAVVESLAASHRAMDQRSFLRGLEQGVVFLARAPGIRIRTIVSAGASRVVALEQESVRPKSSIAREPVRPNSSVVTLGARHCSLSSAKSPGPAGAPPPAGARAGLASSSAITSLLSQPKTTSPCSMPSSS